MNVNALGKVISALIGALTAALVIEIYFRYREREVKK